MTEPPHEPSQEIPLIPVLIDSEVPGRIADLFSIEFDLEFARDCALAYIARHFIDGEPRASVDKSEALLNQALWSSALMSYRRVFTTSRQTMGGEPRFDLRPLLDKLLTTDQQQAHKEFRKVATRHVAHHDSDRQRVHFLACLYPPPLPRGLDGATPLLAQWNAPLLAEAESLVEICNALIAYTDKEVDQFLGDYLDTADKDVIDRLYRQAEQQ